MLSVGSYGVEISIESTSVCRGEYMVFFDACKEMFYDNTNGRDHLVIILLVFGQFSVSGFLFWHEYLLFRVILFDSKKSEINPEKMIHEYFHESSCFEKSIIML